MATDVYAELHKQSYHISDTPDFTIRVIEYKVVTVPQSDDSGQTTRVKKPSTVHEFRIERTKLISRSDVFREMFSSNTSKDSTLTCVDLLEDDPKAVEIWFKVLHDVTDLTSTYDCSIREVWEFMDISNKYAIDPRIAGAKPWFAGWYHVYSRGGAIAYEKHRSLLLPLYTFDHAEGFATTTKFLAYHGTGHITEKKPQGITHDHLRLEGRVIEQLNAARGRSKTILHRGLYGPIDNILRSEMCPTHANTLFFYELALTNTGAWPLESQFLRKSVNDMTTMLASFQDPTAAKVETACLYCDVDFKSSVQTAADETTQYFDGLCKDCLDKSHFKDGNEDYWKHSKKDVTWDRKCRISHRQPTWYFSFMGRKQEQMAGMRNQR